MEFKVGSLADFISGTHDAMNGRVVYLPAEKESKSYPSEVYPESKSGKRLRKRSSPLVDENEVMRSIVESAELNEINEPEIEENFELYISRVKHKKIKRDEEAESRTIFVKNVPCFTNEKILKKKFQKYGIIESVRFRCAPQADIRVPKKVTVIKKDFHSERTNICAFVRFKDSEAVRKALNANGSLFEGHRIFVDRSVMRKEHNQKKAIFLGNIPFGAEENDIWNIFEKCGEITDIRIVRDKKTGLGKGFGFVNFKSADAVELAVTLQGAKLNDCVLRVMRAIKKPPYVKSKVLNVQKMSWKKGYHQSKRDEKTTEGMKTAVSMKNKNFPKNVPKNVRGKTSIEIDGQNHGKNVENKHTFKVKRGQERDNYQFQGQKVADKKKKNKMNKNKLKKKIIAKKLLNIGRKESHCAN